MPSKHHKPRLSKGILEMKFMQRTKVKVEKELEVEQGMALYSKEINDQMLNSTSNFIIEPSFMNCEGLMDGRLSFRGMNPEIERLLELERQEREGSKVQEQPKEVSDKEMAAAYYANLAPAASKSMQKKFQKKNKRKFNEGDGDCETAGGQQHYKKKPKFKKPRHDDDN